MGVLSCTRPQNPKYWNASAWKYSFPTQASQVSFTMWHSSWHIWFYFSLIKHSVNQQIIAIPKKTCVQTSMLTPERNFKCWFSAWWIIQRLLWDAMSSKGFMASVQMSGYTGNGLLFALLQGGSRFQWTHILPVVVIISSRTSDVSIAHKT